MKKQLLLTLSLLFSCIVFSQVKGIVTDVSNNPLAFVNIYIEGTYTGTTSNDDGKYELNILEEKSYTIVFKYLGYKTLKKNITVTAFPYSLDAILAEENINLDEVVINTNDNPANRIIRNTIANR